MFFQKQKPDHPATRPRQSVARQRRDQLPGGQAPAGPPRGGQVYSYRASRSQRQEALGRVSPSKAEQISLWKERLRWLRSTPRILTALVLITLLVMVLRLDARATVVPMSDAKGQVFLRSLQVYEEAAQRTFNASWFNANKLTVNTAQITEDLKQQFPELKTVAISLPLSGNRPIVYVQPAVPALVLSSRSGGVFIIDTEGKALITGNQVPDLSKLNLPAVTDESGLTITPGRVALPRTGISFIREVTGQLGAKQIVIESLSLPAGGGELQMRIAGKPYHIKYNMHGNAREEAGAFLAVKQHLEAAHKVPSQYIDVRVPSRAYYR